MEQTTIIGSGGKSRTGWAGNVTWQYGSLSQASKIGSDGDCAYLASAKKWKNLSTQGLKLHVINVFYDYTPSKLTPADAFISALTPGLFYRRSIFMDVRGIADQSGSSSERAKTMRKLNQNGSVFVFTTLTLALLLFFVGLATDGGRAYLLKAELVRSIDWAAIAAATRINIGLPAGDQRGL